MKYLYVYLIALFFFSLTYENASKEFTTQDLFLILSVTSVAILLQIGVSWFLAKWNSMQNLVLTIFSILNIFTLHVILNERFIALHAFIMVLAFLVWAFVVFTLLTMLDNYKKYSWIGACGLVVAIAVNFFYKPGPAILPDAENGSTSSENVRLVEFERKPNVYLIFFDALIPESLIKKQMKVDRAAYHDVLNKNFRRFENYFVEQVFTMRSLNRVLALDSDYYSALVGRKDNARNHLMTGHVPSPLFQIFKHNGYETSTLYRSGFFGKAKGPHVDYYRAKFDEGACNHLPRKLKPYTFYGVCRFAKVRNITQQVDFLLSNVKEGLDRGKPQVLLGYIYSPGHTQSGFDPQNPEKLTEFVQKYLKDSEKTADSLNKIISFLKEHDPDSILYVSGDHGSYMSRTTTFDAEPEFFVQDRYGVFGGIHPKDVCDQSFSKPYNNEFVTASQGIQMIVRCLSGGQEALVKPNNYVGSIRQGVVSKSLSKSENIRNFQYEDYLYE